MLGQVQRWSVKTEPLGIAVARFVQAVDDLPVADHQRKSTEASFQVGQTARDKWEARGQLRVEIQAPGLPGTFRRTPCYAALLRRRGPHIASHSVCLSVRLSVHPIIVAIGNVFSSTASVTDVLPH